MRRILIAVGVLLMLSATAAQAAVYTLEGYSHGDWVTATVEVDYTADGFSLLVTNTSKADAASLTGLLLGVSDVTLSLTSVTYYSSSSSSDQSVNWSYAATTTPDESGAAISPYAPAITNMVYTGSGFKGGDPLTGILKGDSALFIFTVVTGTLNDLIDPVLARFQGIYYDGMPAGLDDSDIATPTPIPGAAWLLGSGLIGLVGLRRFRS